MKVGKMRQRLEIQSQTRVSDGGGADVIEWTKVAQVYGSIEPVRDRESQFGRENQLRAVTTHTIFIRYRSDVKPKNRIVYSYSRDGVAYTRYFNIKGVINVDFRYKFLELQCEEGVPT